MSNLKVGDRIRITRVPKSCCGCLMYDYTDEIQEVFDHQGRTYYLLVSGQFVWASDVVKDIF